MYSCDQNTGFVEGDKESIAKANNAGFTVGGSWACNDSQVLVLINQSAGNHCVDYIEQAIKNGSLAMVGSEQRLFRGVGLCLIDLATAYGPRSK